MAMTNHRRETYIDAANLERRVFIRCNVCRVGRHFLMRRGGVEEAQEWIDRHECEDVLAREVTT